MRLASSIETKGTAWTAFKQALSTREQTARDAHGRRATSLSENSADDPETADLPRGARR